MVVRRQASPPSPFMKSQNTSIAGIKNYSLDSSDAVRSQLSALGWVAQPISGSVLEITGDFFVQGQYVTIVNGIDVIKAWMDPIPVLVRVKTAPGTYTQVAVSPSGAIYSAAPVQSQTSSTPTAAPVASIPRVLTGGGLIYSNIMLASGTVAEFNGERNVNKWPWLYTEGSMEIRTSGGLVTPGYDPMAKSVFISGTLMTENMPVILPVNRAGSNINAITTMASVNHLNGNTAFANADRMAVISFFTPGVGDQSKMYCLQGILSGINSPSTGFIIGFAEVPQTYQPVRATTGGVAASPLPSDFLRCVYTQVTAPSTSASQITFLVGGYFPQWTPASSGSIIGFAASDYQATVSTTGSMIGSYGLVTPSSALSPRLF